jgi:hypothetical protein
VRSTRWLSQNPGRAEYYSPASDWLRTYQQKTYGGRQTTVNVLQEERPAEKDYYKRKTDRRWVKH